MELNRKTAFPAAPFTLGPHDPKEIAKSNEERRMWMTVGERRFAITLADSKTAEAFAARLPLSLDMAELNGNEKYADLLETLPTKATRPGTMHTGDLMLYGARTLVVFYASFSSSYSYTKIGSIEDSAALSDVLGKDGVRVSFMLD